MFPLLLIAAAVTGVAANVNFLAIGDWGGIPFPPYTLPGQVASVKGMDKIATALNAEFIVALGDNFYFDGVTDSSSKRFAKTWDEVYTPDSLQKDWFVCAGNHDHKGNVSAQIEYSSLNSRWKFPSEYHAKSFESDGVKVDMILLDTSSLASTNGLTDQNDPHYFDKLPEMPRSYGATQWDWLEEQMAASTADYLVIGGHYPVYSVCEHGNNPTMITNLRPLLEKYGAHYMSGHDHCMEHLVENGSTVNYFLTGMGDDCCYKSSEKEGVPEGSLKWYKALDNRDGARAGFTSFTATKESLTAIYYDHDGEVLYTTPAIAPRTVGKK